MLGSPMIYLVYWVLVVGLSQASTLRDDAVKGPIWVSKFTTPTPNEDTSCSLLLDLIDELNIKHVRYDRPQSQRLRFEWVGFRGQVTRDTPEPSLSETEKFQKLNAETKSPLTILYIYGGTFVLNTPSSYRRTTGFLAQSTGSKVLMVHQRLAPQNPFPSALLDVFQAYLTLLSPPPGSPHDRIPPSSIVVAADSSGSCLALGLLQILLRLKRKNASINFHGQSILPTVPAGMTLVSPVSELTNSVPSYQRNAKWDMFPDMENKPYLEQTFPTCAIWPTRPPRADLYCEGAMLAHPLASPAASNDWCGSCPIWLASGQEQTVDAYRLIAQTAHAQGVSVTIQEYEGMPHTFYFFYRQAPQTKKIMGDWVKTILLFSQGAKPPSSASFIRAKGLVSEPMDLEKLVPMTVPEVQEMMYKKTLLFKVPRHHREAHSSL
ncbi:alpha/beta hydrolase fold-domain-containing protein [Talaromyces proteolyticus]|uniref:Alpha/beta hydrolase fold-domain-containing protein n=1 Tax=Talaromyces proteolyticus TaxID=1131652 RepID=A0AAD4KSK3_9EURO|nr:alpha/beta hydrolase fold-domain-containing protein [Talaromyces proteolyticus]KAH8697422.1 alpha/beta hydrolase fold-domain-containing protein [Talaromyces proteolyticus]